MQIAVAVIARPRSPTLDACLGALREAGAAAAVIEIGHDGAGMARNRALATCAGTVLALVEDDVAVGAGWLRALQASWERAAADVAVIGGPLRTRFLGARPRWLGPGLEAALTVVDLGDAALDLDLADQTLHGGNVSFRADALRGAGGFWPARGHADGRDWFSDEHHAQHALGAQSWRGRYEPAAAADRLVPAAALAPAGVVRRRLRYGARLAANGGGRRTADAARALAASAAGALVARGGADRTARAARAAENLGALAGARLVARDFEPTATRTPFRPSVPPPQRGGRRRRRPGALVLLYHRVADERSDPLGLCVAPARFAQHLDVLAAERRVVALDELATEREPGTAAITFDDGYRDNATAAAPALAARALPWTLFASTGHVEEGRPFWWDEVDRAFAAAPRGQEASQLVLELPGGRRAWRTASTEGREQARAAVLAALQPQDADTIAAVLAALHQWAPAPGDGPRAMSLDDLRALAASPGVTIGAHTRTHRGLAYAAPGDQRAEVRGSREDLEAWLGRAPAAFAYPFGVPGADVDAVTLAIVREAGFACAFVNMPGPVTARSDALALPRSAVADIGADAFARRLAQLAR